MFSVFRFDRLWQPYEATHLDNVLMGTDTVIDADETTVETAWEMVARHLEGTVGTPRPQFGLWYHTAQGRFRVFAPRRGYPAQAFALDKI